MYKFDVILTVHRP